MQSDPYSPLIYWPHVLFGVSSVAAVLVAIFAVKGSRMHRTGGSVFAITMAIAATTAIAFSFVRFAPPALFSAFSVIYGVGMGILGLRDRHGVARAGQWLLTLIPLALTLLGVAAVSSLFLSPEPIPPLILSVVTTVALAATAFFALLFVRDIQFLRSPEADRIRRLKRHALRMSIAAAETVRAPLISFGPPLGPDGTFSFPVYFFGPFLIIPLIYFLAMPIWVKQSDAKFTVRTA